MNDVTSGTVEERASHVGWAPKEQFKGDPEKWVDAETYLARAEQFLPIAQANNKKLQRTVSEQAAELAELRGKLTEYDTALKELKEFSSAETKRALERQRNGLLNELREAAKNNDADAITEIMDRLTKTPGPQTETPTQKKTEAPQQDPAFVSWASENQWFMESSSDFNPEKQAIAIVVANKLRKDPLQAGLKGRAFYDKVTEGVDAFFAARTPATSKTESGSTGSGGGAGSSPKGYASLPADAKKVCDEEEKKMVGPNKPFKDQKAWREYYAGMIAQME